MSQGSQGLVQGEQGSVREFFGFAVWVWGLSLGFGFGVWVWGLGLGSGFGFKVSDCLKLKKA